MSGERRAPPAQTIDGLDALFRPRSIAILGASTDPTRIGGRPVYGLRIAGFAGNVYPVNPKYTEGGNVSGHFLGVQNRVVYRCRSL